ncbi:hypothetical protein BLNAU_7855 [Blattamonas nauphoetae]|uniref:Autophagy-related protein 2 n=1 Tax=Blattamonas nauphoetae TaxID=2049346 RepID=A0ABQ9Y0K0_9EUKA|nr:hypothetical protein BLNAU_7855 [Blattamonas nauphoetae]
MQKKAGETPVDGISMILCLFERLLELSWGWTSDVFGCARTIERSPQILSRIAFSANPVRECIQFGCFETLGSLKNKAAEVYETDVRCIRFVRLLEPSTHFNGRTDLDPPPPVSPATAARMKSIALSDDVELDQLTTGPQLVLQTDISPLVVEVTLRTNNNSTAMEMNRFEKMEALIAPAAALYGKGKDEVTLWCCGVRVNPSLALDSLSAHFSLPPQHILAQQDENCDPRQKSRAFWLPEAPVRITLDVMGRDYGVKVVVVCGDAKNEFVRVSSRTSGLELKKMVGDWQQVDWRRVRLWKDEQNEEGGTTETGQMNRKKEGTREGGSLTQRSKRTRQFMSEAGRVQNMTRTLSLRLHCRVAPASMRIVARTETTKHWLNVESWERIGRVRKEIAGVMGREGAELSLFLGEKELRDWDVVSGLTDESEMEISVVDWPGMVLVGVRVNGKEEEHSMCASATLRSLSRRVMLSNRHFSPSSLTFTHNDTPLPLSTRLISLGLSPSLVATLQPAPVQAHKAPIAPWSCIKTTICGFRMDVDTVTKDSRIPLKKFKGSVDFNHVDLINIKTGSLLPFTLNGERYAEIAELSTPLTSSDLVGCTLKLRLEPKSDFVVVRLTLDERPIEVLHITLPRTSLSSLSALRNALEGAVVDLVRRTFLKESHMTRFARDFCLPPLHFNSSLLTEATLSSLLPSTHIDFTCSCFPDCCFVISADFPNAPPLVFPSFVKSGYILSDVNMSNFRMVRYSSTSLNILFMNGQLVTSHRKDPLIALPGAPFLSISSSAPSALVNVDTVSVSGSKKMKQMQFDYLNDLLWLIWEVRKYDAPFLPLDRHQTVDEVFRLVDSLEMLRGRDMDFGWKGINTFSLRAVVNSQICVHFVDSDGVRRQHIAKVGREPCLERDLTRLVEKRGTFRILNDCESSESEGEEGGDERDSEWSSEEVEDDEDTDTPTLFDLKPEYPLSDSSLIEQTVMPEFGVSSTDPDESTETRQTRAPRHRKVRRRMAVRSNGSRNVSLAPKYPLLPDETRVVLDLVKVREVFRVRGTMNKTIERVSVETKHEFRWRCENRPDAFSRSLSLFLSIPLCVMDVKGQKMRRKGLTQFESTRVESVEVVADVEVRSEIVEVSVTVVSGLMECGEMEGTLREDHFSFSLPLSSSFLSLERLLREQLPQLGNVCWFADGRLPSTPPIDSTMHPEPSQSPLLSRHPSLPFETVIARFNFVRNPQESIHSQEDFPSLPIRLTAVESLLPDCPTTLVSIDGVRTAFVAQTNSTSPLALVWPPTDAFTVDRSLPPDSLHPSPPFPPHSLLSLSFISHNPFLSEEEDLSLVSLFNTPPDPLDVSSICLPLNLRRVKSEQDSILSSEREREENMRQLKQGIFDSCMTDLTSCLSPSTASPNSRPDESTTPLRLWIETPMRRVMGLFGGSATVHDVLFFVGSLHCVCAPLSFHKHALFVGNEKLDGLVTVSEIVHAFGSVVSLQTIVRDGCT